MEATLNNLTKYNEETKRNEPISTIEEIDEKVRMKVVNPITFKCYGKTTRATNGDIGRAIKGMFLPVLHDLLGVYVDYVPNATGGYWPVTMFFQHNAIPCPDGKIRSLETVAENSINNGIDPRYAAMMQTNSKNTFELNYATKCILAPYMYDECSSPKSKAWKKFENEHHDRAQTMYYNNRNADVITFSVGGFNIYKLLKAIYGKRMIISTEKREDGTIENHTVDAFYDITINANKPNMPGTNELILNIEQYDGNGIKEIYARENPQYAVNGIRYF